MNLRPQARAVGPIPAPEPHAQAIDLRDLLWRLRRYGWVLLLPIVTALCAAAIYTRHVAPVYQAYLVVSVDDPTDVSAGLRPFVQGGDNQRDPRERITLVDGRIHNYSFLKAIAERMDMGKDPVLLARAAEATKKMSGVLPTEYALRMAVGQLWGKILVGQGRGTSIQITVRDTSPEFARDLAAVIGDLLLQQSLQTTLERVQARGEFSKDQIAVYEERLRQAQDALRVFQETHIRKTIGGGIGSEQEFQLTQSFQRSAEEDVAQLRSRILASSDEWRARAGTAPMPVLSSDRASDLAGQLSSLERASATAQVATRGAPSTEVDAIRSRITAARQALFVEFDRLSQEMDGDFTPESRSTAAGIALDRAVLRSLQARADRFGTIISNYVTDVQRSPRDKMEEQRLIDNVTAARNILTTFQNEAVSGRVSEALATSQVGPRLEIVEHPLLPLQPASLSASVTYAMAGFLGLVIDAVIVFAGERLAAVVRTVEQAEAEYGLKVLGVVPRIFNRQRPGGYLRNHWPKLAILSVLVITALIVVIEIAVFPRPKAAKPAPTQTQP